MRAWLTSTFPGGHFQGNGDYLCSSPLREDKHPSFSISPGKRAWRDFATGEGGKLSELCAELGIEEPPREGGAIHTPPPSRPEPSKAEALWDAAAPASHEHPYLQRKRLPADGLRQDGKYLLIPARTLGGRLVGVERIPPEPDAEPKRLHVGEKAGGFHFIGSPVDGQPVALAEGMATASAIFALSGMVAASVFGAPNLPKAARLIKAHFPRSEVVVCADADAAGQKAGEECRALGCSVIEHLPDSPPGWDWWDAQAQSFDEAREAFKAALGKGRAARVEPEPEPEPPREEEGYHSSFKLTRADALELKEPECLIGGILERDSLAAVFGESGSAKSFFALDLLASIATGCTFHGRPVEEAPCVYLCGEGNRAIKRRLVAWEKGRGVSLAGAPLFVSNRAAVLPDESTEKELMAAVDAIVQETGQVPGVIAFDTLARSLAGDENSNSDMGAFIAAADALRQRYDGCAVVLVHHTGHQDKGRMRGASALRGALDLEILVQKDGGHITVDSTKQKDAGGFEPMHFSLETVPVMVAKNGEDVTSCFLGEMEEAPREGKRGLSETLHLALQSFHKAAEHAGTLDAEGKFLGVHLDRWRPFYYEASTADNQEAKKVAFQRHRAALVKAGALSVSNDVYTLAGDLAKLQGNQYAKKLQAVNRNTEQERNMPEQCSDGEPL